MHASAVIGLIAVGIGVIAAVAYAFSDRRQQQSRYHSTGGGATGGTTRTRQMHNWEEDEDYPYNDGSRTRRRRPTENISDDDETISKESNDLSFRCPICFESFQDLKRKGISIYTVTDCGHTFCYDCLKKAIGDNQVCPNCRARTLIKDCHKIFI